MISHDHATEDLQQRSVDNLTLDGIVTGLHEGLIAHATDATDPFDHPHSEHGLRFEQRAALQKVRAGLREYMLATGCTGTAVREYRDNVDYWGAA